MLKITYKILKTAPAAKAEAIDLANSLAKYPGNPRVLAVGLPDGTVNPPALGVPMSGQCGPSVFDSIVVYTARPLDLTWVTNQILPALTHHGELFIISGSFWAIGFTAWPKPSA
jgi:hypothetical protein